MGKEVERVDLHRYFSWSSIIFKSWVTLFLPLLWLVASGTGIQAQEGNPVEGKIIIGGHGHAMVGTSELREHLETVEKAAFDGVLVNVNPNFMQEDPQLRLHRNWTWCGAPARTVEDYSMAIEDLKHIKDRAKRLKHSIMLMTLRTVGEFDKRAHPIDWLEDDWSIVANNAYVAGVICREGGLEGIWLDFESSGGGPFNWKDYRRGTASYEEYCKVVRQRGREWMAAACRAKPDIVVLISHAYGDIVGFGGAYDTLAQSVYGLMPPFVDGLLEGCTPQAKIVHSGEATYSHMTYAAFKHYVDKQRTVTAELTQVPELAARHFSYATSLWPDFRSDRDGFDMTELSKNHYTPEKLKHAFYNAMAASDKYVWTWDMKVHWWPTYNMVESRSQVEEYRRVFPKAYMKALADCRQKMDLDWTPGLDDNAKYPRAAFDTATALKEIGENYDVLADLKDGWLFALDPDDTDNWGVEFTEYRIYPGRWKPIAIGDYWENRDYPYNGIGWYRHKFTIPEAARNKRIYAGIGGVKDNAKVYVTRAGQRSTQVGKCGGDQVGIFDITEAIDPAGENLLTLKVHNPGGPGGLYGTAMIVSSKHAVGKQAYITMRGSDKQPWGHWVKDPRFHDHRNFKLGEEFTVDTRIRVPASGSYLAHLGGSSPHAGFEIRFAPNRATFDEKDYVVDTSQWHEYRVVVARGEPGKYIKTFYVDGKEVARTVADDRKGGPKSSGLDWGTSWVTKAQLATTPKVNMDLDWIRYARRAIVPTEKLPVFEAGPRKETFWDEIFDGDAVPSMVGWKYWPEGDPTTITQVVIPDPANLGPTGIQTIQKTPKDILFEWSSGGPKIIPRDFPMIGSQGTQTVVELKKQQISGAPYAAQLTIPADLGESYGWPGLTLENLAITDWSSYRAFALSLYNPMDRQVEIGIKVYDEDKDYWYRYYTVPAGSGTAISIPITDLRQKMDPARVLAVGFNRRRVKEQQQFVFSDLYLLKSVPVPAATAEKVANQLPPDGDAWTERVNWGRSAQSVSQLAGNAELVSDVVRVGKRSVRVQQQIYLNYGAYFELPSSVNANDWKSLRLFIKTNRTATANILIELGTQRLGWSDYRYKIHVPITGAFDWKEFVIPLNQVADGATFKVAGADATVEKGGPNADLKKINLIHISSEGNAKDNSYMWIDGVVFQK